MAGDQSESLEVLQKVADLSSPGDASAPFAHVGSAPGTPNRRIEPHFFALLVAATNDAVISKTLEGIITTWNRAATRLFGYRAEEAV